MNLNAGVFLGFVQMLILALLSSKMCSHLSGLGHLNFRPSRYISAESLREAEGFKYLTKAKNFSISLFRSFSASKIGENFVLLSPTLTSSRTFYQLDMVKQIALWTKVFD